MWADDIPYARLIDLLTRACHHINTCHLGNWWFAPLFVKFWLYALTSYYKHSNSKSSFVYGLPSMDTLIFLALLIWHDRGTVGSIRKTIRATTQPRLINKFCAHGEQRRNISRWHQPAVPCIFLVFQIKRVFNSYLDVQVKEYVWITFVPLLTSCLHLFFINNCLSTRCFNSWTPYHGTNVGGDGKSRAKLASGSGFLSSPALIYFLVMCSGLLM